LLPINNKNVILLKYCGKKHNNQSPHWRQNLKNSRKTMLTDTALCWLRRDLRLFDHAALYQATRNHARVACVFIFDQMILESLPRTDRRVEFIWHALKEIKQTLQAQGSDLLVLHGWVPEQLTAVVQQLKIHTVYAAEDYEPAARSRDAAVAEHLATLGCQLELIKDQVIFARDEILSQTRTPYSVFTPYKNAWLARMSPPDWIPYASQEQLTQLLPLAPTPMPTLAEIGFLPSDLKQQGVALGESGGQQLLTEFAAQIDGYQQQRDFPALDASSHLSPHLRFGTISIRSAVALASERHGAGAACWLSELIWREFYQQLLWHHPRVEGESFKLHYRDLPYQNNQQWFAAWRDGQTGFPLVDAAMRQLAQTGWMHNRLRMISASFLVKDLLIDWRWGEQYFAEQLLDFDLAANNGGWQWAASTGCDAQPYFRIFNPVSQSQRFDPDGHFIRHYVPELHNLSDKAIHAPWLARSLPAEFTLGKDYPMPLVEHALQRQKALDLYKR
jgi:deoxyribodipyrimidine photo-lyase